MSMKTTQLDGIATIVENGVFNFDPAKTATEQIFDKTKKLRGTIIINDDGSVSFKPDRTAVNVAPQMDFILREGMLRVQRTTQNYIVTMKFPIVETQKETASEHRDMWEKALDAIKDSRNNIKESF